MALNFVNEKYFKMLNPETSGTSSDLATKCHICGDSKTKRKRRLHLFNKGSDIDTVHCFNCGYSSNAYNYFKEFHSDIFSQYQRELKNSAFNAFLSKNKGELSLRDINDNTTDKKLLEPLELSEFKDYFRPISNEALAYLKNRNISTQDIEKYSILSGVKESNLFGKSLNLENFFIIPLINKENLVYGFQARSITEKKFYTIILPNYPKIWGLNTLRDNSMIFVFEGIIDAISSGFDSTLAVLGIGSTPELLKNYKNCVIFFDNQEKCGASLAMCKKLAKLGYNIVVWTHPQAKDVNDLLQFYTKDAIQRIAYEKTLNGIMAFVKLSLI